MKIVPALLGVAAAALSSLALAAPALAEEVVFAFDLDRAALTTEAGAAAVYADLVVQARIACTLPGVRGFDAVDAVCAAELIDKVVIASGSVVLEDQYAGSQYAAIVGAEVSGIQVASR